MSACLFYVYVLFLYRVLSYFFVWILCWSLCCVGYILFMLLCHVIIPCLYKLLLLFETISRKQVNTLEARNINVGLHEVWDESIICDTKIYHFISGMIPKYIILYQEWHKKYQNLHRVWYKKYYFSTGIRLELSLDKGVGQEISLYIRLQTWNIAWCQVWTRNIILHQVWFKKYHLTSGKLWYVLDRWSFN